MNYNSLLVVRLLFETYNIQRCINYLKLKQDLFFYSSFIFFKLCLQKIYIRLQRVNTIEIYNINFDKRKSSHWKINVFKTIVRSIDKNCLYMLSNVIAFILLAFAFQSNVTFCRFIMWIFN